MNSHVRYAAHFVFAGKDLIHRKSYIERGSNSLLIHPFTEELEHTLFYNGILIPVSPSNPFSSHEILQDLLRNQVQHKKLSIFDNLSETLEAYITTDVNAKIWLLGGDLLSLQLLLESTITEL